MPTVGVALLLLYVAHTLVDFSHDHSGTAQVLARCLQKGDSSVDEDASYDDFEKRSCRNTTETVGFTEAVEITEAAETNESSITNETTASTETVRSDRPRQDLAKNEQGKSVGRSSSGDEAEKKKRWEDAASAECPVRCLRNRTSGPVNGGNESEIEGTGEDSGGRRWQCDSVFTSLNFWGANIVIFANMIYMIPYLIVVFVYFAAPGLRARAYDRAVICYNVSQILLNGVLIGIGFSILCHVSFDPRIYIPLGLVIMFLTISSTFWLFVICFDMTLAITRFRWAPPSDANRQGEARKFGIYAACSWGGSLFPTAIACVVELAPLLPKSSPLRPNFAKFDQSPNVAVVVYVATLPVLICVTNTVLFCYTTYKMILIRKSTAVASASSTAAKKARRSYAVFLRLYLLMDAPYLTSALGAVFTNLWLLKFLRMIQPILMLFAILPRETVARAFEWHCCKRNGNRPTAGAVE